MCIRLCVLVGFVAAFLACTETSGQHALSPSPASNVIPSGLTAQPAGAESKQHAVSMMDACDPESFDAARAAPLVGVLERLLIVLSEWRPQQAT